MIFAGIFILIIDFFGSMSYMPYILLKCMLSVCVVFIQELGQLEIKHGLLQLAETLSFLHNNARLIHRALSPEVGVAVTC